MKQKIIAALLLSYKNRGFSQKVIDALAASLESTITEETQIEAAVAALEPMLGAFQSETDTRVQAAIAKLKTPGQETQEDQKDSSAKPADEMQAMLKTLLDKVSALEQGKSTDSRKTQLQTALKDAPEAYRNAELKRFDRMNFKDDDDFTTYLGETKTDAEAFGQSVADTGLSNQGKPFVPGAGVQPKELVADIQKWADAKNPPAAAAK